MNVQGAGSQASPLRAAAHYTARFKRLRDLTPYILALLMPGGSVVAVGLYLYQRRRTKAACDGAAQFDVHVLRPQPCTNALGGPGDCN
jgi:hypothetical protein